MVKEMMRKAVLTLCFFPLALAAEPCEGISELRQACRSERYEEPSPTILKSADKLFSKLFSGEEDLAAIKALSLELPFDLVEVSRAGESFLVLKESGRPKKGWGVYVFRRKNHVPVVIEAPHSFDDLYTGDLTELLFLESRAHAAAWNTAPRSVKIPGKAETADLAHLPDSIFHSFTRALAAAHPRGILLQLHGFDRNDRASDRGMKSDIILSDGTRAPPEWLFQMKPCLERELSEGVSVFPRDVAELGAMTNTHKKLLQGLGHHGFLHLEMSLPLRRQLKSSAELRKALWRCVPEKQP
jgi:hypothetical protein